MGRTDGQKYLVGFLKRKKYLKVLPELENTSSSVGGWLVSNMHNRYEQRMYVGEVISQSPKNCNTHLY